ncbi:hypothetical protein BST81_25415 [Leptolyngbya sp. 'hensonii']|uniref:hypothetical protein n=1 Tax=Leptolyngbya sp. 'hensonii' TaxID=1922337 RepID=UPI00095005E1|nr:hypothetical protein [Leptolyngbya sp. 'hensonii']OLP15615.1 hypothetical protein BST81_25415 [Leptolyngbya sp. 'hensonii']
MGFMTALFGKKTAVAPATHSLPVAPGGDLDTLRSAPLVQQPRYFDKPQADALQQLASDRTAGARQTVRAYNHLTRIEEADTRVHRAHRRYQGAVADNKLTRDRADARLQRKGQQLRPEYERLHQGVQRATQNADTRIAELRRLMGA